MGVRLTFPSPFSATNPHRPLSLLSLNADLGGDCQSINSSPNKQVFQNRSLWISLPISFFNPDSCQADGGDPPARETNSAEVPCWWGTELEGPGRPMQAPEPVTWQGERAPTWPPDGPLSARPPLLSTARAEGLACPEEEVGSAVQWLGL